MLVTYFLSYLWIDYLHLLFYRMYYFCRALQPVLNDSEEEIMTTRFELNKMD